MHRFFTYHWQNRFWSDEFNSEYSPLNSSSGSGFRKRGVSLGDKVYIISLQDGKLLLGGRMIVRRFTTRSEAVEILKNDDLWDTDEWAIGEKTEGTPMNFHRRLSGEVTKQLCYILVNGERCGLSFDSDNKLNNQATRGVRELTPESATLLDRILAVTDAMPRSAEWITVTMDMLNGLATTTEGEPYGSSAGTAADVQYHEGNSQRILVDRYERDLRARAKCIEHYGAVCCACGFDFAKTYGVAMQGFIHVHHLRPLAAIKRDYIVDPIQDMRPMCPNCHAVVHSKNPPYSPEEVKQLLRKRP